ncbi:Dedicator of cytokinesis protein 6, partial [Coelomomyces lativittatus]
MNGPTPLQLTRSQSLLSHATTEHTKKLNQPPESSFHRLTHQHPSFQSVIKRVADDGFPLNELFNVPTDHCTISYSKHPWSFHHYAWTSSSDTKEIEIESQTTPGLTTDSSVWDPASKCILDFYQQPKAQFHFPYTSHADFHPLSELPTSPSSSSSFPSSLLQTYLDPSFETYLVPQPRSRLFPFTSTPPSPSSPCSSTLPTSWITLDAFTSTFPSLSSPLLEGTIRMAIYDPVSQRKLTPDSDGGVGGRGPVSSPLTAWSIDVLVYPESVLVIRLDRPLLSLPSSSSSSMSMTSSTYFQPWCFHVIPLAQLTWPHPPSIQVTFDTLVLCRPTEPFMTTLTSFLLDPKKRDWKLVPCHGSLHFSKHDDTNNNNNNDKDARDSIPKTPMHPETGGRGGVTLFPWIPPPSTASSFSSPSSAASFRSHVVYVFPKSLLWKKKTSPTQTPTHPPKQKFRNVLCVIEMYNGLKRVPCIYSLTRPHQRLESAHTRVWYHEKNPFFEDEIKMDLPLNPNGHFLKFTFYHVACKPKQAGKLTCFGSSIFFLTSPQGSYTPEGLSTLSVVSNLPQPLTTTLATATDPLVFECEVAYDSALVVTHPSLYALLVHQELPTHLHDLASFYTSSRFPMVVHRCLDLSQEGPTGGTLMLDLFRVLMLWISTASVDDLLGFLNRSILPPPAPHPLHAWRVAVREVTLVDTWEPFVWFLGAWVTRSLALEEGVARDLDPTPFSIVISEISKLVFERSTQYVNKAKQLNNQLAYFIRDLIPFFPFSQIQSWFCLHLHTVTPTSSILDIQLKLDSLWILSGYEHPIPLSYVICQCIPFVFHEVVDIRITSLSLLRNLVCLRISTLPIPLCIYLLETLFPCVPLLSSTKEPSETFFSRTLILCILLLFQRVPDKYLSTWMSGFMEIATWISHLKPLIDMFHYPSDDAVRDRLTIIRQVLHARTAKHHLEERFKDFSPLPTKTKFIKGKDSTSLITSTHIEQENELSNQVMLVVVSILDVLLVSLTHKTFASFMPFILEFLNFRLRPSTLGQLVLRMIKLIDFHPTAVLEFHLDPFLKTIMTYALSLDLELRLLGAQLLANMFQSCFQYHLSTFTLFRIHLTRTIAKLSLTDAHTMHLCLETMQQLQIEKNDKEKDLKSLNFLEE